MIELASALSDVTRPFVFRAVDVFQGGLYLGSAWVIGACALMAALELGTMFCVFLIYRELNGRVEEV